MRYLKSGDRVMVSDTGSGVIDGFVMDDNGEIVAHVVLDDEDAWCEGLTGLLRADSLARVMLQ